MTQNLAIGRISRSAVARCGRHLVVAGVVLAAMLWALPAVAQSTDPDYEAIYERLWQVIARQYFDPEFRGTDWTALRGPYRQRAASVGDDEAFRALANELLSELDSSHLRIGGPGRSAWPTGIGARFTMLDGDQIVADVVPGSDAEAAGLAAGDRLLSSLEALRGERGSTARLEVERCDGDTTVLEIEREQVYWPIRPPYVSWSCGEVAGVGTVAELRVSRFDDGAAEEIDEAMDALLDADVLIIDLRRTIGGNMSALRLASWFAPSAEPAIVLVSRQYLRALGRRPGAADLERLPRVTGAYTGGAVYDALNNTRSAAAFWTESLPRGFDGRVFVLNAENTRSAAEALARYMRRHTDAVLVGRPTAGSLLSAREFPLGDGWWVSVPVHGVWGPDGTEYSDRAVPPHVEVAWTREALCNGLDPDVEAVLEQLRSESLSPAR